MQSPLRAPSSEARPGPVSAYGLETRLCFPRRAEEAEMNVLGRVFHALCVWTGFADAAGSHLTPSHGWLLPAPADARRTALAARGQRA